MTTKDWKNRELPTLLTEKWGFSFNLLTESQEEPVEEGMCQQCAPNPFTCGMMQEQEEELEEGQSSSARESTPDREQNDDRRSSRKTRPMEEAAEPENKDKADLDKDGKLSSYEKKRSAAIEKSMEDEKGKMNEAQIRHLIRKLVKEAMKRKETK